MREGEIFVGLAQVHVRIDLQDAHSGMAIRQGPNVAQGRAVVPAEQGHQLTLVEVVRRLGIDPVHHGGTSGVDFVQTLGQTRRG